MTRKELEEKAREVIELDMEHSDATPEEIERALAGATDEELERFLEEA